MKFHELLSAMNKSDLQYKSAMAAIKFDLGDAADVVAMRDLSTCEFYKLPAPQCLFQCQIDDQTQWYLAEESKEHNGVLWQGFIKDKTGLLESSIALMVYEDGQAHCGRKDMSSKDRRITIVPYTELTDGESLIAQIIIGVARSIEVFSCCNVETIEHAPPKFINSKRISKGKIPFFSYRTLHIKQEESANTGQSTGTHASPRLHLRRGHIRRIHGDKRIWIRASLVGDKSKGLISKDYKVGP